MPLKQIRSRHRLPSSKTGTGGLCASRNMRREFSQEDGTRSAFIPQEEPFASHSPSIATMQSAELLGHRRRLLGGSNKLCWPMRCHKVLAPAASMEKGIIVLDQDNLTRSSFDSSPKKGFNETNKSFDNSLATTWGLWLFSIPLGGQKGPRVFAPSS